MILVGTGGAPKFVIQVECGTSHIKPCSGFHVCALRMQDGQHISPIRTTPAPLESFGSTDVYRQTATSHTQPQRLGLAQHSMHSHTHDQLYMYATSARRAETHRNRASESFRPLSLRGMATYTSVEFSVRFFTCLTPFTPMFWPNTASVPYNSMTVRSKIQLHARYKPLKYVKPTNGFTLFARNIRQTTTPFEFCRAKLYE